MGGRRGRGPLNFFVTVVVGVCVLCGALVLNVSMSVNNAR